MRLVSNQAAHAPATRGVRFAPSPTGRFHVGNLRTAWISHQFARALRVPWVIRMEDIDEPRVLKGARELQLEDMAALGLTPDLVLTQSSFREHHWDLFMRGVMSGLIYACDCSRKDVQVQIASAPHSRDGIAYSGRCRQLGARQFKASETIAWRFKMPDESGKDDFIVARSSADLDGVSMPAKSTYIPAYHWACAIDDFDGEYDLLVRSSDLSAALKPQRAIQNWLAELECDLHIPAVFHTSLIVQNDGHRLEKRTQGVTLPELLNRGLSTAALLWKFQSSFDGELLRLHPASGDVFGEAIAQLSLHDLSLV